MSSDGFHITIPELDDEELYSTPIPFGRTPGGHGFGYGGTSSVPESPTAVTPMPQQDRGGDRSYFHSRTDSVTSEDSSMSYSARYAPPSQPTKPFAHSTSSSVATSSSSPFTKKPSFASIRNAFKSGKSSEPPPVPPLDREAYPVLKNPFNRSNSSLAQPAVLRKPSVGTASPPNQRPPTPGSDPRYGRGGASRSRGHTYTRSQHSQTGSVFHNSDTGSDLGHGGYFPPSSPPPVPRVPESFRGSLDEGGPSDLDDKVVMDPRTPAEYALHAVFIRFVTAAEMKMDAFLRQPLESDPLLIDHMGPDIDSKFDDLLHSLGRIAQKNAKAVIDSIMRWRRSQNGDAHPDVFRFHMDQSPVAARGQGLKSQDARSVLSERKSLSAIYIMCRALIAVMEVIPKDALGDTVGHELEDRTFEQFKTPHLKLLAQSANHRVNADLYAILLGLLANVRFEDVTDKFLKELGPVAAGQVPKDLDAKYENLVRGLRHVQIKVWPPEAFEQGAEFLESLSKSFSNAHGFRLKSAFAETLVRMLHPIGKTAQAEVNHPDWAKAIEVIYPRARDMVSKPRYWHAAYPLVVTSLCVAPQDYFLKNWTACFEAGLPKLKDKPYRIPVLNGMIRLIWTYLYRCPEAASTTTSKLDILLKHLFPANRLSIFPPEEHLEPFIYIIHFVLSRHADFGRDFCLELIQEQAVSSPTANVTNLVSPERLAIAVQAILLSLHLMEREEFAPTWPSNADFTDLPALEDYPVSSEFITQSVMAKSGMQEFFDRCGSTLATIASAAGAMVAKMSLFDDQWSASRLGSNYEELRNHYVFHRHPEGFVAYPMQVSPQINMLYTCFLSWPRLLHPDLPTAEALDMLIRGVIHVEPLVAGAASHALRRFMDSPDYAPVLLTRYSSFLFDPIHIAQEGSGIKLVLTSAPLLNLWVTLVDHWIQGLLEQDRHSFTEEQEMEITAKIEELEAGSLFLLSHIERRIRAAGVQVLRNLASLLAHMSPEPSSPGMHVADSPKRVLDLLRDQDMTKSYLYGFDELLPTQEAIDRLEQWQRSIRPEAPLRIAESADPRDQDIWQHVFPAIIHTAVERAIDLTRSRESMITATFKYHLVVASLAGVSSRAPVSAASRSPSNGEKEGARQVQEHMNTISQWRTWVRVICCTASADTRSGINGREHSRAPSEANLDRERMMTTRGLFRSLAPFLDSEHSVFRDAAVLCISAFPSAGYPQLLEDLNLLSARQIYDESRVKSGTPSTPARTRRQERFYAAVARIYYLTAPLLRDQRAAGKQVALAHVLKFVRHTQAFLTSPDVRQKYMLQRLRRYFCGAVERLFDGLATLKDSDRFIPPNMHLSLYRLCEEWCQYGNQSEAVKQRLFVMQASAADMNDPYKKAEGVKRFQDETKKLSNAAIGALAVLCRKAYFPPEVSSGSPTDAGQEYSKPLDAFSTLDRWNAILASYDPAIQSQAKKALKSLLAYPVHDTALLDEALRRAFVISKDLDTSNARFFEVVAEVVSTSVDHGFSFSQTVCLGLSNLCHHLPEVRRLALNMLETIHQRYHGELPLARFEAAVGSAAPSMYLHAHRLISDVLANEHPDQASNVLAQFVSWMPRVLDTTYGRTHLLLLQSLEFWIPGLDLMSEDKSELSKEGRGILYNLIILTLRYADSYSEQVLTFWTALVEPPRQYNGHATVRFLLEQSHKVGSIPFITCASKVVACLSQSAVGRQIYEELCSVIEPARMLPTIEHKLAHPNADEIELWSDLDALFSEQPRQSLGAGQFALLFLSDVALERQWEQEAQLPALMHALFVHVDHRQPFIQQAARHMLLQLLRAWMPGYDELPDQSLHANRDALQSLIANIEHTPDEIFWREDESASVSEDKMRRLGAKILSSMEPLHPRLPERWGSLALSWGTGCSIRAIAFRSLQVFRALMPKVTQADLALLLGRLSNTVSAPDENIQKFSAEIILTLNVVCASSDLDPSLLPQLFWCAAACLATAVEREFAQVITLFDCLLDRLDLDDPETAEFLISQQPRDWTGSSTVQSSLLRGLRSSNTYEATFKLLQRLAKIDDPRLIDSSDSRVRDLYTMCLPWCLQAMHEESYDEGLLEFSSNVSRLAEKEDRSSIRRILDSFANRRFRTKDDFFQQSVSSLREHYGADQWTQVASLLLGLILNNESWLRVQSMHILKLLFQHRDRDTRTPLTLVGSELLMPLLRLLETELAPQALAVLEEPMTVSGGPSAKHVLRMSMNIKRLAKDAESATDIFGAPEESGWCVARPDSVREHCRANAMAVFDTCKVPTRPSRIDFEPEDVEAFTDLPDDNLGDLVENLHELSTFFQKNNAHGASGVPMPLPTRQLEARVAAILAKSTETMDSPQTPFVDVFNVADMEVFDDSDDSSSSDSESDAFVFDSIDSFELIQPAGPIRTNGANGYNH